MTKLLLLFINNILINNNPIKEINNKQNISNTLQRLLALILANYNYLKQ